MALGTIGKYERLDVLGHGASGIVYLARDTLLRRQVAIKEVSAQGGERERILDEARLLDRLRHPNIVEVHGVDTVGGKIVIDMEYVDGRNLLELLREEEGPLGVDRSVDIAAQVCDGLAYANARHVVHRDIKPANILVGNNGQIKLVDFGLAQVMGTNSFVGGAGTYAYMAPEDFDEDAASDAQSDIWAVGVILYEMLTGRRPFSVARPKDPFAWKRAIESQPIEPPHEVISDVPESLSTICLTALERRRADRYRTAGDFSAALRNFQMLSSQAAREQSRDDDEHIVFVSPTLLGATDVDTILSVAIDHWEQCREALCDGRLSRWLWTIGEGPLAEVAQSACDRDTANDDDRDGLLRDFLYRAGLDTAAMAHRSASAGSSYLRAGAFEEAVDALTAAVRMDTSRPAYFIQLYKALDGLGDHAAAIAAIARGVELHPRDRALRKTHLRLTATSPSVSHESIDFGAVRPGDRVRSRIVVRNTVGNTGVLRGRVVSSPAWVEAAPMTFVTRHQQPIALVATTNHLLESDRDYAGSVEIETNCGDLSVGVRISVASPLRAFGDIYHWYLPLFVSALAPIFAGEIATLSNAEHAPFYCVGLLAGGLLFAAAWVVCTAAETGPAERMAMAAGSSLTLLGVWLFWINRHVHALGPALLFSVVPSGVLFVAQGLFMQRYSASWGRWQVWGWVVGAIAALVTFFLWRAAQ